MQRVLSCLVSDSFATPWAVVCQAPLVSIRGQINGFWKTAWHGRPGSFTKCSATFGGQRPSWMLGNNSPPCAGWSPYLSLDRGKMMLLDWMPAEEEHSWGRSTLKGHTYQAPLLTMSSWPMSIKISFGFKSLFFWNEDELLSIKKQKTNAIGEKPEQKSPKHNNKT